MISMPNGVLSVGQEIINRVDEGLGEEAEDHVEEVS